MRTPSSGGGLQAIAYTLRKAREVGPLKLWQAMRSSNACKTCALGMGGQRGGMVNERGHFPEVCKKSLQAMAADMQGAIRPEFWQRYSLDHLRAFTPRELEYCGRLTQPLIADPGATHYRVATWEEALDAVAERLRATPAEETFWYTSGRSSNEAGFLLQLLARVLGTNHVNNCSYYCHQASGVGLASAVGSGTATIELADLEQADLVVLIGGNPASNHPRLMTTLMHVRRQGGKVLVINPVVEVGLVRFRVPSDVRSMLLGSEIATEYVQPHVGGDLALLTGWAKRIVELGAEDRAFLTDHCEGWPQLAQRLAETGWDEIEQKSGVPRATIDALAGTYAASKRSVFAWTMGITHHVHGVENVQAIANLALLRGMVGRTGAGLLPIRGHSNVQGIGSMGVTPQLKQAVFDRLEAELGISLPRTPGFDTLGCLEAAAAGQMKFGFCLGGNLFGASPDSLFVRQAFARLEQVVYLNTTLNTGHAWGLGQQTVVLPVLARDEESQATTQESMFNYVRYSEGGPRRLEGPRGEVEIVAELAQRAAGNRGIDWARFRHHRAIRQAISRAIPGCEPLAKIDESQQEFAIGGRVLHAPRFPTPTGRARLQAHTLPPLAGEPGQLRLMSVRSEGQFNTVVYEDYDLYRGQDRRDVILMHPDDLARLRLEAERPVRVRSAVGQIDGLLARPFPAIRAGSALVYFPECNPLVPRSADPASRTPAFKNIPVWVEPLAERAARTEPAAAHDSGTGPTEISATAAPSGPPTIVGAAPVAEAGRGFSRPKAC